MATWLLPGKSRSQSSAAQSRSYGKGAKAMQTMDVTEKEKRNSGSSEANTIRSKKGNYLYTVSVPVL